MANHQKNILPIKLSDHNPDDTNDFLSKEHAEESLQTNILKLSLLQEQLYASQTHSLLIILQGMDTSGKDSLIKHAFTGINPQGCDVHGFKTPNTFELNHAYMWRYGQNLPMRGMIKIFNRSYYEEVTVVRVHPEFLLQRGLKETPQLWQQRFLEFNQFEEYLHHNNIVVVKVFLHISKDEQHKRLKKRMDNPDKHWKFSISDVRERRYWDEYMQSYEEAFSATNTKNAPWHILPANNKWYARLKFSMILVKTLEKLNLHFPKVTLDLKNTLS
jgi:PPK2 family polyphosphate:nucleotide phosphotransferase